MCDSLALSDVIEIFLVAGIIFIPIGYFIRHYQYKLKLIINLLIKPANVTKYDSLQDFINKNKR